jgi:DNA-binding LacI/PurR family transcriptional regulator
MTKTGYVAPPPARRRGPKTDAVRGIRTRRVAMLLIGMDPWLTQRLTAPGPVAESLAEHGFQLVFAPMSDPAVLPRDISPKYLDGVVLQGLEPTGAAERALRALPCVWMMTRRSKDFWADYVEPDNQLVSRLAFDYLAKKGVPRMAFLNLQPNYPAFAARGAAFFEACKRANMEYRDLSEDALDQSDRLHDEHSAPGVEQQIERLMPMLKKGPVGLFTAGHNYLPSVYRALLSRSVRLGRDVTLVAGDYDPLVRAALIPMPACVDVQIPVIGQRVIKQLMWRIANREAPGPEGVVVPPRLVTPDLEDAFVEF